MKSDNPLVEAVKDHANKHYTEGGWDVIVECYDNSQIEETITGATTADEAIEKFKPIISYYAERQADAVNSQF